MPLAPVILRRSRGVRVALWTEGGRRRPAGGTAGGAGGREERGSRRTPQRSGMALRRLAALAGALIGGKERQLGGESAQVKDALDLP
jgi:hypothetical protein